MRGDRGTTKLREEGDIMNLFDIWDFFYIQAGVFLFWISFPVLTNTNIYGCYTD